MKLPAHIRQQLSNTRLDQAYERALASEPRRPMRRPLRMWREETHGKMPIPVDRPANQD